MKPEDQIFFAGKLLDLIRELEEIVIDYCRILTSNDDGHMLEEDGYEKVPF